MWNGKTAKWKLLEIHNELRLTVCTNEAYDIQ